MVKYITGFLTLVAGLGIIFLSINSMCLKRVEGLYVTPPPCIDNPTFWLLVAIGTIIALIGAYMCYYSRR